MPVTVRQVGEQFCVMEPDEETPRPGRCHDTEDEAERQARAINANLDDESTSEALQRASEQDEPAQVQTVILKKDRFENARDAMAWMRERIEGGRDFIVENMRETDTSFRFEQFPEDDCENRPSTIQLTDGVSAVICAKPSASEAISLSPVRVAQETPDQFHHRLIHLTREDLLASADHLRYHATRVRRTGIPHIGRGWGHGELMTALRATESLFQAREQELSMTPRPNRDTVRPRREGGIHAHSLDDDGNALTGGRHAHAFLYQGSILFTELDGAHGHEPGEGERTDQEQEHTHSAEIELPDGEVLRVTFEQTTPHDHEKLASTTALDGLHQHTATIDGEPVTTLTPEEFRTLFGVIEEIHLSPSLAEAVGASTIHTGGDSLLGYWRKGRGTEAVRELLASYVRDDDGPVREAVEEHEVGAKFTTAEGFAINLGHQAMAIQERDEDRFILIASADGPPRVLREFNTSMANARLAATAAITDELEHVTLAEFVGTALDGPAEGREIFRELSNYWLQHEPRAAEAIAAQAIDLALDQLTRKAGEHGCGWFTARAAEADSHSWDVVIIQAGLSRNRNFWPARVLEGLVDVFEGAPLEAIQASPTKMSHLQADALMQLNGHSVALNGAGQLKNVRWEPGEGGRTPDDAEVRTLAKVLGVSEAEVKRQSRGRLVATAMLDQSDVGNAVEDRLASAEDRDSLDDYLGLSIDVDRAPAVGIKVPGGKPILLRTDVDGDAGKVVVDFVSHPSAGGRVLGRSAA